MLIKLFLCNVILFICFALMLATNAPGCSEQERENWPDFLTITLGLWCGLSIMSIPAMLIYQIWIW